MAAGKRGVPKGRHRKHSSRPNYGWITGTVIIAGGMVLLIAYTTFGPRGGMLPAPPSDTSVNPPSRGEMVSSSGGNGGWPVLSGVASQTQQATQTDQPAISSRQANGVPKTVPVTALKNPSAGVGLGNVVGVMSHFRLMAHSNSDPNEDFQALQVAPEPLLTDTWKVEVDKAPPKMNLEMREKPIRIKVPTGSQKRDPSIEDIVFPCVPSPFVVVGTNVDVNDQRQVWNITSGERIGVLRGISAETKHGALSPDGRFYAAQLGAASQSVAIYDFVDKKSLPEVDAKRGLAVVAMPRPTMLVLIGQGIASLWRMPSRTFQRDINLGGDRSDDKSVTFSPGGRYMANRWQKESAEEYRVYDLNTGEIVGKIPLPTYQGVPSLRFAGIAFSRDGTEVATLVNSEHCSKLVIWSVADGSLVSHMTFPEELQTLTTNSIYDPIPLMWFPGQKRLLVYGAIVIDRESGTVAWNLTSRESTSNRNRHAVTATHVTDLEATATSQFVVVSPLPEDKIKDKIKQSLAQRAESAALKTELFRTVVTQQPMVSTTNLPRGMQLAAASEQKWEFLPDSAAPVTPGAVRPITLSTKGGSLREVAVSGGESPRVVALRSNGDDPLGRVTDGNLSPSEFIRRRSQSVRNISEVSGTFSADGLEKHRAWVEIHDGKSGIKQLEIEMPMDGDLLGVSPDGSRFLFWPATKSGTLELYSTDDGQPIVGWSPYSEEVGDNNRDLVGAALIDSNHAMSMNGAGRLVVWQLPQAKALFVVESVSQPAISPNGRYVSYADGQNYHFVEVATGTVKGSLRNVGDVNAVAYHPIGTRLAMLSAQDGAYHLSEVDLTTGKQATPFPVPSLSGFLHWCGDDYVLLDNQKLIDLRQRAVAWTYGLNGNHFPTLLNDRYGYVASVSGRQTLLTAKLPCDAAESILAEASLRSEFLLQPGGKCSLNVQLGALGNSVAGQAIEKKIREQLVKNKITVETGQPVTLSLTTAETQGETQKLGYWRVGAKGYETFSVMFTHRTMACRATVDGPGGSGWDVSSSISNSGHRLSYGKGEMPDVEMKQGYQARCREFFEGLVLPPYIFTPRSAHGMGLTTLGRNN